MQNPAKNRHKRPYRYGNWDIAKMAGVNLKALEYARSKGYYNPSDIISVVAYIHRCHLKANKPRKNGKRKALPSEPPKESDSTT